MAETTESVTKNIINPRVEIDTSPPFESVKEAVDRFGGSGPWIPHHLLRLAADHHGNEVFDVGEMEEQAVQLERDLIMKEQETLNVLKELEAAKRFVEYLKLNLMQEVASFMSGPDRNMVSGFPVNDNETQRLSLCPVPSSGLISFELNQAKSDLNKMSIDLDVIRGSVESLNKTMRKEKVLFESRTNRQIPTSKGVLSFEESRYTSRGRPDIDQKVEREGGSGNSLNLFKELTQMNFEAEQFKKMTEASRYEVMKAMTEIERTKNSIKMAEMRLNAAKKMEEAAKAVEAICFAEKSAVFIGENSSDHKPNGITLSFEDYRTLIQKVQQAEEVCKTKFMEANATPGTKDTYQSEVAIVEKFEQTIENKQSQEVDFDKKGTHRTEVASEECYPKMLMEHDRVQNFDNRSAKFKFRNSHPSLGHRNPQVPNGNESYVKKEKSKSGFKTTSIGDILSRKLILQDDFMVGKHVENHTERQHISLSQMLREQSRLILHPTKPMADGNVEKQYFVQRKKFGFIQVPLPRSSKKKTQPLNMSGPWIRHQMLHLAADHMELEDMQPHEEERGALYVVGFFGSDRVVPTHDDDNDFVDPPQL
ncbi:WEB family protein [Abeliophyllum distichum]|uniref:WEB family protein n=1 Tax=Abeliophyllum distichum TaxID=126358 RepID=A0ABD1UNX7_9LAMI